MVRGRFADLRRERLRSPADARRGRRKPEATVNDAADVVDSICPLALQRDREMRIPRVRITIRGAMIGVAVVALVLWLILAVRWDSRVGHGIGHTSIPLVFSVCDAVSGAPIEGATIRLEDPDFASSPMPPWVVALETGRDGRVTFVLETHVYMVRRRSSPEWKWRIVYPQWVMTVAAGGYAEFSAGFADHAAERGGVGFHKGPLPPPSLPIEIKLQRRRPAGDAGGR